MGSPDRFDLSAGERGKRLLGSAEPAVHQFVGAQHHREFSASSHQAKFDVRAGHGCRIDLLPRNHATLLRCFRFGYPSIWVSPQIEIACPEIVLPRGLHMNRI